MKKYSFIHKKFCRKDHRMFLPAAAAAAVLCLTAVLPAASVSAADGYEETADWTEHEDAAKVLSYGMTPIDGSHVTDGTYEIDVTSSSSYFRIDYAELTVADGEMTAVVHFDSTAYSYVYLGTPEEAAAADLNDYVECEDTGMETIFEFPVASLNAPQNCAAFSKDREQWYGRCLLFEAASLPADALDITLPDYDLIEDALEDAGEDPEELILQALESGSSDTDAENRSDSDNANGSDAAADSDNIDGSDTADSQTADADFYDTAAAAIDLDDGEYSIEADMSGGSGRATISSPMLLTVLDGRAYATVLWSSRYYDYMIVNDVTYLNESEEGSPSSFTIPILSWDEPFTVIADTTAMDEPVEIEYTLTFYKDTVGSKSMIPQEAAMRVISVSVIIIILGAIVNHFVQKKREQ